MSFDKDEQFIRCGLRRMFPRLGYRVTKTLTKALLNIDDALCTRIPCRNLDTAQRFDHIVGNGSFRLKNKKYCITYNITVMETMIGDTWEDGDIWWAEFSDEFIGCFSAAAKGEEYYDSRITKRTPCTGYEFKMYKPIILLPPGVLLVREGDEIVMIREEYET